MTKGELDSESRPTPQKKQKIKMRGQCLPGGFLVCGEEDTKPLDLQTPTGSEGKRITNLLEKCSYTSKEKKLEASPPHQVPQQVLGKESLTGRAQGVDQPLTAIRDSPERSRVAARGLKRH